MATLGLEPTTFWVPVMYLSNQTPGWPSLELLFYYYYYYYDYCYYSTFLFYFLRSICTVVAKVLDLDLEGWWFKPRRSHNKICRALE